MLRAPMLMRGVLSQDPTNGSAHVVACCAACAACDLAQRRAIADAGVAVHEGVFRQVDAGSRRALAWRACTNGEPLDLRCYNGRLLNPKRLPHADTGNSSCSA